MPCPAVNGASTQTLPAHTPDMQQLLAHLAEQVNPKAQPKLQWIQATVRHSIQMIPVAEVLFFISDEKYTRVQTATLETLIRKPIKELVDELDMTRDERGRQLVSVRGHPEKLEVSRSYPGLFKSM